MVVHIHWITQFSTIPKCIWSTMNGCSFTSYLPSYPPTFNDLLSDAHGHHTEAVLHVATQDLELRLEDGWSHSNPLIVSWGCHRLSHGIYGAFRFVIGLHLVFHPFRWEFHPKSQRFMDSSMTLESSIWIILCYSTILLVIIPKLLLLKY